MTKGKKKQRRNIILLCICLIVIIIVYILVVKKEQKETMVTEDDSTTSSITSTTSDVMLSYPSVEVKQITVTNEYGTLSYSIEEDIIHNVDDKDMPVNQTYGGNLFNGIAELKTTSSLGTVDNLAEYGLDNPSIIVKVQGIKRADEVILFGDTVPADGGRYAMLEGSNEVYTVNNIYYNYYNYSKVNMTEMEVLPSITSDYITKLVVSKGDEVQLSLSYDEAKPSDLSGANFWTLENSSISLAGSVDDITTFLGNYTSFSYVECVDYNATELSKYGLDNPTKIAISYYEPDTTDTTGEGKQVEKEFMLYIGNTIDGNTVDGNYYVKEMNSTAVYTMSSSNVSKLLDYNIFTLANKFVSLVNIKNVEAIKITGEIDTTLTILSGEKKADSEEYNYTYKALEKEIAEDTFKGFYQSLIGIKYDRELLDTEKDKVVSNKPTLTITFQLTDGRVQTVDYLSFDNNYYQVVINGTKLFLVDKRVVKEVLDSEKNL